MISKLGFLQKALGAYKGERGVTWYNLASDPFTGPNAVTVPGTLRDSLNLLALVLEQDTELSADRDHDRHCRLYRHDFWDIPSAWLPV